MSADTETARASTEQDHLLRLVEVEIPQDQARLKNLKDVNAERLLTELHATVLEYVRESSRHMVEVRDWTYQSMNAISEHLEATDERLDMVESFGTETVLLPEDAELLAKVSVGCKFIAQQLLMGPFPITERDEEGKQKLAELIAMCEQTERIIQESVVSLDDQDEADDEIEQDAETN